MRSAARGVLIGLCAMAISAVAVTADAQRWSAKGRGMQQPRFERVEDYLELSDSQVDEMKALREEHMDRMADLRKEMLKVRNQMRGEMLEDNPDMAALKKLVAEKGRIRTDMETAGLEHRMAMRDLLTEKQRDRLMMFRGRDGKSFFGRGGRRGGFGRRGAGPGFGFDDDAGIFRPGCDGTGPGPFLWCEEWDSPK